MDGLKPIWTTDDFRDVVVALRALGAAEHDTPAPVIDIATRERIG